MSANNQTSPELAAAQKRIAELEGTLKNQQDKPELSAAQKRIAELEGSVTNLKDQLQGVDAAERAILKKMALGLSRPQAIAAIKSQAAFGPALKKHNDELRKTRREQQTKAAKA